MAEPENHDFPDAVGVISDAYDTAQDGLRAAASAGAVPEYAKLGNVTSLLQIGAHAKAGEYENVAQDIGVGAAQAVLGGLIAGTALAASAPVAVGLIGGAAAVYGFGKLLDAGIDYLQEHPELLDPLFPDPNSSDPNNGNRPSRDYRIEYYDPLILDLNGDGEIGTIAANKFQGAVFDGNNDGIRTATGWVSPEDGLLVRDINSDGLINSGAELFGDSTKLANGTNAKNGFAALSDLDSNGDGKVDSNDTNFNELKVWKDINGDGVSQASELFSLNDVGIQSLNVNINEIKNEQVEGGYLAETGSYTKADGSLGKMADVNFENQDIYSKFTSQVEVTQDVSVLPQLKGYGRLKDLHQVAMQSTEFKNLLSQYVNATTRSEQKELLDNLVKSWAKSDPAYSNDPIEIIRMINVEWYQSSNSENVIYVRRGDPVPTYLITPPPPPEIADANLTAKVRFVDAFLGREPTTQLNQYLADQISSIEQIYDFVKESIFSDLLNQTILKPYLDSVDMYLGLEKDEVYFDFSNLEQIFSQKIILSPLVAIEDLKDLLEINGNFLDIAGWEKGFVLLQQWRDDFSNDPALKLLIDQVFADVDTHSTNGTNGNDFNVIGNSENTIFDAGSGDDIVMIDTDIDITVNGGSGNDIIISGKNNDFLNGGEGNNTYILFKGAGKDFINYENLSTGTDKIAFTDVSSNEAVFYQQSHNLVIKYGTDEVTLLGALDSTSIKNISFRFKDQVLSLTTILETPLQNISGSSDELYINGWRGIDLLTGNDLGNQIYGFDGNDTLIGGKGSDRLYGGSGNDTYHFELGDGIDEIHELDYFLEENNVVFQNINTSDISNITFQDSDLIIQYGLTDRVILKNYILNSQNSALNIQFADQATWNNSDLMSRVTFEGSDNSEVIIGTLNNRPNIINAYDGNDEVRGNLVTQNLIDGGLGDDRLHGGNAIDHIQGGLGDDFVFGLAGNDEINGSEGDDTLFGGMGDDLIIGGNGRDWLQGDDGVNTLIGGMGDDSYDVNGTDTIIENEDEGYDAIFIENNFDLERTNLEEIHLKGSGDFNAIGDAKENGLYGNSGNNYLDGKGGADIMSGGGGEDYYVVNQYDKLITNSDGSTALIRGDQVVEGILNPAGYVFGDSGGIDTIEQSDDHRFYSQDQNGNWYDTGSYHILQSNIENLILKGNAKTAFGNELNNIIVGNSQDNYIDGLEGDDTYIFAKGGGTDTYNFEDSIDAVNILKIQGYSTNDVFAQKYGNSVYLSFKGTNDHIWLSNYYVADTDDMTYRMDQIIFDSGTTWSSTDIDTLVNRALNNHAPTVNAAIPMITSNQGTVFSYKFASNVIIDQDSWDSLSYKITLTTKDSSGQYQLIPSWLTFDPVTQTLSGTPPSSVTGDLSFFYWGTDMYGLGTGTSFTLKVNPPNQAPIVLNAIADQSFTDAKAFSYTIPSTAFKDPDGDALTYTATLEDGSALPSWLTFNATTRVLSGTAPESTAPLNIKIIAKDTANQSVSDIFKVSFVVQNLTLSGTSSADTLYGGSGNDSITGLAGNDILYGQSGNDTLDGGAGNDTLYGGKGDDIYVVDSISDSVNENSSEGIDTVQSSVTYTLSNANVENLTLTGTSAISGTGNALNNILTGNSGNNTLTSGAGNDTLNGGAGTDTLIGGLGDDLYIIDSTTDTLTENTNEGTDTVQSSVTYTLGNNLENLILTGTSAINGTGNLLNNTITGNSAGNTLSGGTGADTLIGGLGDDIYVIDNTSDIVTENTSEGTDSVQSSVTYGLSANVENLTLTGTTAINGTGNALNNVLTGNSANNTLTGGAGNDTLNGGAGTDTLIGGLGDDLYVIDSTTDTLTENANEGADTV
ncbi:putative Ig domain-containing protein, partial [Acinetobacter junii]|uniref:putative Ig domain-containing protein n=1 Tax=Acinetobacter junii TaxID=40215 RepID=UPI00124F9763